MEAYKFLRTSHEFVRPHPCRLKGTKVLSHLKDFALRKELWHFLAQTGLLREVFFLPVQPFRSHYSYGPRKWSIA
jgi:hypothetical protein